MVQRSTPFALFEEFEINSKGVPKKRNLRFDINALADFEQLTGMGFGQLMMTKAVFATARAMLWAGLKWEDRSLTVEHVGFLIGQYIQNNKGNIDDLLTTAFVAARDQGAFGDQAKDGEPDAGNETNGSSLGVQPTGPNGSPLSSPLGSEN